MTETKKYFPIITLMMSIVMILLAIIKCWTRNRNADKVKCVTLITLLQLVRPNGQFINLEDSTTIFYYKDIILYQVPYKREISNFEVDTANKTFHQKLIKTETRFTYFIYKKNDSNGFAYDSLSAKNYESIRVDTFLNNQPYHSLKFYDKQNDSLVQVVKDSENNVVIEKYIPKTKFDDTYCDTTRLYFATKFKNIEFSFSKELDSLGKMKLFKARFMYDPTPILPRREFLFELKEGRACNSKEITQFLKKFQIQE